MTDTTSTRDADMALYESLTPREKQIAVALASGDRNHDIATRLEISPKTVDTHRGHLLTKLKCRHNVDLAKLLIRLDLVTP